jgi:uncharacterized protein
MSKNLSDIWKLKRRGKRDSTRHKELVKEAIKKNSKDIIQQYDVVTTDGDKKVKVPIRFLDQYRFKYGKLFDKKGAGQGLSGKEGQRYKIGQGNKKQSPGRKAGDEEGSHEYNEEITIDEMVDIMIDQLNLPWMKETALTSVVSTVEEFDSIERKGLMSNLDVKKTVLNNMKRNIVKGNDKLIGDFSNDDLRYRTWDEQKEYSSKAAIYLMMDTSGSMSFAKKDIAKTFYFWMVQFLRRKYKDVDLVFITHDVSAQEVTEDQFFKISSSGGTKCSSAFKLAYSIMTERHDPNNYNTYVFEFSDGDNSKTDNKICLEYINKMLDRCRAVGYGEIFSTDEDTLPYWIDEDTVLSKYLSDNISRTRFVSLVLGSKSQIFNALQKFFNIKEKTE